MTESALVRYVLDDLYGYDVLIAPGVIGNPPADGYIIRVRGRNHDRVTIDRVPPTVRVVFDE